MGALVAYKDAHRALSVSLGKKLGELAQLGVKNPGRMVRIALNECARNPRLLECDGPSLVRTVMKAGELGLDLGSSLGHAYIVPFWNGKKQCSEATLITGYKGLILLALDSPRLRNITCAVVREGEPFDHTEGTSPSIMHKPAVEPNGRVIGAYAVAHFTAGGSQPEWVPASKLDAIKQDSLSKQKDWQRAKSPWTLHTEKMQRKTAVRSLVNLLDLSERLRQAVSYEDEAFHHERMGGDRTARLIGKVATQVGEDTKLPPLDDVDASILEGELISEEEM